MTEVKKDVAPAPDAPKSTIQERRIVLPEDGGTPEEVKQAVETYKKAKMQFETKRKENETKQKELEERKAESGEAEAGVAAQPPFDKPKSIRYEIP